MEIGGESNVLSPAEVEAALRTVNVKWSEGGQTWRLSVNAKQPVTDAAWSVEHDTVLLTALRRLEALGGLPQGAAARSANSWSEAAAQLRTCKLGIAGCAVQPSRAVNHWCNPGYESSCKQARCSVLGRERSFSVSDSHTHLLACAVSAQVGERRRGEVAALQRRGAAAAV
jgi:hypothetical protein